MSLPITELNESGSVRIPQDIIERMGLQPGDQFEVFIDGGITLIRINDYCCICGGTDHPLKQFGEAKICASCIRKIKLL